MSKSIDKIEGCSAFDAINLGWTKHHSHYDCTISNPQRDSVLNRITQGDVEFRFSSGNFEHNIAINVTGNVINITWKDIIYCSKDGVKSGKMGLTFGK